MSRVQGVLVGGGALLVLAGAILVGGAGQASGQAGASMSIAPASKNVPSNGDIFNVEVKVENVTNLGAYDFTVTFDPAVLEYIGSKDNGFLASTGRPQVCTGFGLSASTVNTNRALHASCSTNGLIENGVGKPGPNGSGVLATIAFKPKAVGTSNLVFVGLDDGEPYYIGAPDPSKPEGAKEQAFTSLAHVEVCNPECVPALGFPMSDQTGVVGVYDPTKATPTALPPTPTPEPRTERPESEQRKTVAAAVGTPRLLPTPAATSAAGTTAASDGTSDVAGAGTGSGGTGSSGSSGNTLGASGGPGNAPGGVPRGPDGAPIAGYGPQDQARSPWWLRSGLLMLVLGLAAITLGAAQRNAAGEQQRAEGAPWREDT
jgi:hypothetical protein